MQDYSFLNINDLRKSIDRLDSSLMFLLAERTHQMAKVGSVKKHLQLPMDYSEARKKDLATVFDVAVQYHIPLTFIQCLYQRIFTESLKIMQQHLTPPHSNIKKQHSSLQSILTELQHSLLHLDMAMCQVLIERFRMVEKVGRYKKIHHIKPLAHQRWQAVLLNKINMAQQLNISEAFIKDFFNLIHEHALKIETAILNS